jgi:fibronectin-binding autotransporter adhesin
LSTCVAFGEVGVQMSAVINVIGGTVIDNGAGAVLVLNNVNLNGGTMSAQGGHATANFQLNGTMSVTGTEPSLMTSTAAANIYGLRSTIFNVSDVTTSPAADLTISGVLGTGFGGSTAGFIKTGAGTMLLTTNNTYTGTTTISNGTLQVNGKIDSSDATVMTNAVLCGTGTLGSNVTVNAGGILAAGTTNANTAVISTAIAGTLTLQDNSRLLVDVLSLSQNDLITVAGNVSLTPTLKVEVSGGVTRSGTWTILQSTSGTILGTLPATVIGGTKGATLTLSTDSKQLLLTFLPQGTLIRFL